MRLIYTFERLTFPNHNSRKERNFEDNTHTLFSPMTTRNYQHIKVGTKEELVAKGVEFMKQKIVSSLTNNDICIIGLSGGTDELKWQMCWFQRWMSILIFFEGTTPWPIYEKLGSDEEIEWNKVYIFLVDERFVCWFVEWLKRSVFQSFLHNRYLDKNHQDSNQRSLNNTLLKNKTIPTSNVVLPNTSLPLVKKPPHTISYCFSLFFERRKNFKYEVIVLFFCTTTTGWMCERLFRSIKSTSLQIQNSNCRSCHVGSWWRWAHCESFSNSWQISSWQSSRSFHVCSSNNNTKQKSKTIFTTTNHRCPSIDEFSVEWFTQQQKDFLEKIASQPHFQLLPMPNVKFSFYKDLINFVFGKRWSMRKLTTFGICVVVVFVCEVFTKNWMCLCFLLDGQHTEFLKLVVQQSSVLKNEEK